MPRELKIERLDDEFGQYLLILSCPCGHVRECEPRSLANFAGWHVRIDDLVRRMRCSICGRKTCSARPVALVKSRGWQDPRR